MTMAKSKGDGSFEQALARLEKIVAELETGNLGLDEALAKYEEGVKALGVCQDVLAKAEKRIEQLAKFDEQGRPVTAPFEGVEATTAESAAVEKGES